MCGQTIIDRITVFDGANLFLASKHSSVKANGTVKVTFDKMVYSHFEGTEFYYHDYLQFFAHDAKTGKEYKGWHKLGYGHKDEPIFMTPVNDRGNPINVFLYKRIQ